MLDIKRFYQNQKKKIIVAGLIVCLAFFSIALFLFYHKQAINSLRYAILEDFEGPKIITVSVEPKKVRPGDIMTITTEIEDKSGVSLVTANMGGIETLGLKLIKGSRRQGTWQAQWLVHGTEVKEYLTVITAQNNKGLNSSFEISWSDPPVEAMLAYAEGTVQTPRYRIWDGTAWSAENSALDVGGATNAIEWVVLKAAPTRDEYILGTLGADGNVNIQVYDGGAGTWGNLTEIATGIGAADDYRGFDIAYETSSGDAVIVTSNGVAGQLNYYIWNGSVWSTASTISFTTITGVINWVKLASHPSTDEIALIVLDANANVAAMIWDGTAWSNEPAAALETANNFATKESVTVEYMQTAGKAMFVWSPNLSQFEYNTWDNVNGWGTEGSTATGDDLNWVSLKPDPNSDQLILSYVDTDSDGGTVIWDGTAWGAYAEHDSSMETKTSRPIDCDFETITGHSGHIVCVLGEGTTVDYTHWDGIDWSNLTAITGADDSVVVQTRRIGNGIIFYNAFESILNNYEGANWDGTAWSTVTVFNITPSTSDLQAMEPFMMAAQIFVPSNAPIINSITFNGSSNIILNEGTYKWASTTIAVSDADGCADISSVTATVYRTPISTNGTTCTGDDNNCYIDTWYNACTATTTGDTCLGGTDTSVEYDCGFKIWYIADPTDAGTYASDIWAVAATTTDSGSLTGTATNTAETIEIISLNALDVTSSIDYGTLSAGSDTGATNQITTITTTGNTAIDSEISGTDLTGVGTITVDNQKYATSTATYASLDYTLSSTAASLELDSVKPTSTTTPETDDVYWGLNVPTGSPSGDYKGVNTFSAISD